MFDTRKLSVCLTPLVAIAAPAQAADSLTAAEAMNLLFPQAQNFLPSHAKLSRDQKKAISQLAGVTQRGSEQLVWKAIGSGGSLLGWAIVDEVIGKHEFITYAAGISRDGHVVGVEILEYRETHGGEVQEAAWRDHFKGKTLDEPFELNKDLPNISGATLSCRNVTKGVKRLLALWKLELSP